MTDNKWVPMMNRFCMICLFSFSFLLMSWTTPYFTLNQSCEIALKTELYKSKADQSIFKISNTSCKITALKIEIFDKYGDLIYSNEDLNFEWDANQEAYAVDGASYFYVLTYKTEESEAFESQEGYLFIWD